MSTQKKKLLFIIWSFSFGGGAESVLRNIVNHLDSNKYDIDILEYYHSNVKVEKLNASIQLLDPILKYNDSKVKQILTNSAVFFFPHLFRRNYKKKYDVEIAFNYLIPIFLVDKKTKFLCWIHGSIYDLKKKRLLRFKQGVKLKKAEKVIAISEETYDSIKCFYPFLTNVKLLENGYNLEYIKLKAEESIDCEERNYILYCNRLDENKQPLLLIELAKELKKRKVERKIIVLGSGNLEKKLCDMIYTEGLDENIRILGYQKNPYPYIKRAFLSIILSKTEGFSTFGMESLSLGIPIITTEVGGAKKMIDNENNGYIIKNIKEAADRIQMLTYDKEKYEVMKKQCIQFTKHYDIKYKVKEIEDLIK